MNAFPRNVTVFHIDPYSLAARSERATDECFLRNRLQPIGALEVTRSGWVSPYGNGSDVLVQRTLPGTLRFALGILTKILPAAVVNQAVAERATKLAAERDKPVGGRERKRIREEVVTELLQVALVRQVNVVAWIDLGASLLFVDTASSKTAELVVTALRATIGSLPARPLEPSESPRAVMTDWLGAGETNGPDAFELDDAVDLFDPSDEKRTARLRRTDLTGVEVEEHLKAGKMVSSLALVHAERLAFTLTEHLVLKRLALTDVALEALGDDDRDSAEAETNARFVLSHGAIKSALDDLFAVMGCQAPQWGKGDA